MAKSPVVGTLKLAQTGSWLAPAVLVFVSAFIVFGLRLNYTLTHILVSNCILGGDNTMFSAGGASGHYALIARFKHMLVYLSLAGVTEFVHLVVKPRLAAFNVALALAAAFALSLLFIFLVRRGVSVLTAGAAVLFAGSTFSVITIFSIAESYAVIGAAIGFVLLVVGEMAPLADSKPWLAGAATGAAVGVAGLATAPLAALLVLLPILTLEGARKNLVRFGLSRLVLPAAIALPLSAGPLLLLGPRTGYGTGAFVAEYMSVGHLFEPATLARYLTSLAAFTWVSPLPLAQSNYPVEAFASLVSSPLRLVALAASLIVMIGALATAVKPDAGGASPAGAPSRRRWVLAILVVCAGLWTFQAMFNPLEVLLYASQWALLVSVAVGLAIERWGRRGALALLACAVLNLAVNWSAVLYPIDKAATVCPQNGMKVDAAMEAEARSVTRSR